MRNPRGPVPISGGAGGSAKRVPSRHWIRHLWLLAAAAVLLPAFGQSYPSVKAVDPSSGKVNDDVTLTGSNLDKNKVAAVYLSDAKVDHKAGILQQSSEKIMIKVPDVKAGNYNVSIQVGGNILILPLRFKVTS